VSGDALAARLGRRRMLAATGFVFRFLGQSQRLELRVLASAAARSFSI